MTKKGLQIILFYSFLVIQLPLQAQNLHLTVRDAKTEETIPFANVVFNSLKDNKQSFAVTDDQGQVHITVTLPASVSVSYVGYSKYTDTLETSGPVSILLEPRIFDLDEVVVTGSTQPEKVDRSIYNIQVLSRREIELKGATDMTELLSKELNLRINQDAVLGSGITIRGLTGNNVKVLIDGVPVIGRLGGNIDLSQLDVQNIDHVEIVEGPMSTVYGSNALAGVINIITRTADNQGWRAGVNTYYESAGVYNGDFRFSAGKKKYFFGLSGGRRFFDGFSVNDSLRSQLWKPKEQYNGDLLYGYRFNRGQLKFQSTVMNERLLQKGDLLPPYFEKAFDSWFHTFRATNRVQFNYGWNDNLTTSGLLSYNLYRRRKETYFKDLTTLNQILSGNPADHDTTKFSALVFRETAELKLPGNITLQGGLDFNYETGSGKRIDRGTRSIGDYALFLSSRIPVAAGLELQPGLRTAYNTEFRVPLVPSLNLKWTPMKKFNVRLSYARGYRAPSLKELYIYFVDINHNILPNPNLEPENGNSYNLTAELNTELKPKIHFSNYKLDLFYNNLSNIIKLARQPLDNELVYQYININYYRTVGGSFLFKYHYYPNFRFSLGYGTTGTSYAFTRDGTKLSDYSFSQEVNSNMEWIIKPLDATISAHYKYTGRAIIFEIDEDMNIREGSINDYHTLDVVVQKSLLKKQLNVSFGGKNLFNNTDIETTGNISSGVHSGGEGTTPVGWGRTWFVGLKYSINGK